MDWPSLAPDQYAGPGYYDAMYFKPALAFILLREEILGPERFDYAFREFVKQWAFKHPGPYDLMRNIENAAGEDLNWFWKSWFYTNEKLDQAIEQVSGGNGLHRSADREPKSNETYRLRSRLTMRMETIRERLPVEIWFKGDTWTIRHPKKGRFEIHPDRSGSLKLPDLDREAIIAYQF